MQCDVTHSELVSFHFGDIGEPDRSRVEAHLRRCGACLDAYLALKRSMEAAELEPSQAARARLRDAVAAELAQAQLGAQPAPWQWWERPLAVTFATVAVAVLSITVGRL